MCARIRSYAAAGADCVYAPGAKTREHIAAVVQGGGKPVNLLVSTPTRSTSRDDLEALGVRRISVGGALARVAMDAFIKSARVIASEGKFDSFGGIMTNAELNTFFGDDRKASSTNRP